jgi:drug/metabolite transporter (DMT)-like permease
MTVVLVVISAFLHASWNAMVKHSVRPRAAGLGFIATAAVAAAMAMAWEVVATHVSPFPTSAGLGWALMSGALETGYIATLLAGLSRAGLPVVYTISRGGALLLVWPISVLALSERVTAMDALAVAALLAGLLLCGLEGTQLAKGAAWGAACGVFIAGYHLTYKLALAAGATPAGVFTISMCVAIPANWLLAGTSGRVEALAAWRERPWWIVAGGLVSAASFLVFLAALRDAGAGLAFSLRNTSVVFAAALGWALGEPRRRREVVGVLIVAASAVALAV